MRAHSTDHRSVSSHPDDRPSRQGDLQEREREPSRPRQSSRLPVATPSGCEGASAHRMADEDVLWSVRRFDCSSCRQRIPWPDGVELRKGRLVILVTSLFGRDQEWTRDGVHWTHPKVRKRYLRDACHAMAQALGATPRAPPGRFELLSASVDARSHRESTKDRRTATPRRRPSSGRGHHSRSLTR